jgi:O-antigen/teichoic acid export membrane protein
VDVVLSLVSLLIVTLTASWIETLLPGRGETAGLAVAFSTSFVASSLRGTSTAVLAGLNRFGDLAWLEVAERVLSFLAVGVLLFSGFSVEAFVIGLAMAQSAAGLIMAVVAGRRMSEAGVPSWWRGGEGASDCVGTDIVRLFGWNYLIVSVSGIVAHLPLTLLGYVRGAEEAGFYRLATNIGNTVSNIDSVLGRIAHSRLSAEVLTRQVHWAELRKVVGSWTVRFGIPLGVVIVATITVLSPVIETVFGPGYQPMVSAAALMVIASAVGTTFFWLLPLYYALGQLKAWGVVYSVYGLIGVCLVFLLAEAWGFWGVSAIIVTARLLFVGTMLIIVPRVVGESDAHN